MASSPTVLPNPAPAGRGRDAPRPPAVNDPLLARLLAAATDEQRDAAIEHLIVEHLRPVIERVLRHRCRFAFVGEEPEDLAATVVLRLVRRLRRLADDERAGITSVTNFAARLTFNALNDAARRRFPARTRLKNRVRYVLTHDARFLTRATPHGVVCALAQWGDRAAAGTVPPAPGAVDTGFPQSRLAEAVTAILGASGAPVLVADLVRELAAVWRLNEREPRAMTSGDVARDGADALEQRLAARQYLVTLWREIGALRPQQRAALLLNLRDPDGHNALALFVRVGVATIDSLAAAATLTVDQLAGIWNDLPLADLRIAGLLGATRQQVINLRKAARHRLARRMTHA